MNNKLILGVVVVVLVGGAYYYFSKNSYQQPGMMPQTPSNATQSNTTVNTSTSKSQNEVTIKNFAYSPASLTVKVGDKVTWTNQDSAGHSATADDGSFDTGVLSNGQSGSFTFSRAGTFSYHCSVHPNMKATVVVTQ